MNEAYFLTGLIFGMLIGFGIFSYLYYRKSLMEKNSDETKNRI